MKKLTYSQFVITIKQLLDQGQLVIEEIRVNNGEDIANYTALSECPPEHREGYRRALETGGIVYIRDVVYDPVFVTTENATSVATLE